MVTDMDNKEEEVQHYNHYVEHKAIGVWKSPYGSMINEVKLIIYKTK